MTRRRFRLTEDQIKELVDAYEQTDSESLRVRLQSVRLYGTNHTVEEILECTGYSRTSLMEWCRKYRRDGLPGLEEHRRGGNRALLTQAQLGDLRQRLVMHTPGEFCGPEEPSPPSQYWQVRYLRRALEEWYGVRYKSRTSYLRLFALCGITTLWSPKRRTGGYVPAGDVADLNDAQ